MKKIIFAGVALLLIAASLYMLYSPRDHSISELGNEKTSQGINTTELPAAQSTTVIQLKDGDTYDMVASFVKKEINGKEVKMLAYNGSIPAPIIKVPQDAEITINFKNNTDIDTTNTLSWHTSGQ